MLVIIAHKLLQEFKKFAKLKLKTLQSALQTLNVTTGDSVSSPFRQLPLKQTALHIILYQKEQSSLQQMQLQESQVKHVPLVIQQFYKTEITIVHSKNTPMLQNKT